MMASKLRAMPGYAIVTPTVEEADLLEKAKATVEEEKFDDEQEAVSLASFISGSQPEPKTQLPYLATGILLSCNVGPAESMDEFKIDEGAKVHYIRRQSVSMDDGSVIMGISAIMAVEEDID